MSVTAAMYLLNTDKLEGLLQSAKIIVKKSFLSKKITDNYWDYLSTNATVFKDFPGSGYIFGNLLIFLEEEKSIDLLQGEYDAIEKELMDERGSSHFIFTNKQRISFVNQLDPANYALEEIRKFNEEFSDEGDEETAKLMMTALDLLRENLSKVKQDDQVLLLIVG